MAQIIEFPTVNVRAFIKHKRFVIDRYLEAMKLHEQYREQYLVSDHSVDRQFAWQWQAQASYWGQQLDQMAALDDAAARFLQTAAARLAWSARGTHRALKVARTIADLAGSEHITVAHVAEAMQYRRVLRTTV